MRPIFPNKEKWEKKIEEEEEEGRKRREENMNTDVEEGRRRRGEDEDEDERGKYQRNSGTNTGSSFLIEDILCQGTKVS